ncbi:membrane glycoprotein LIG-1 [Sarcoptes scabiei]|nr:membrane glycoprotein LIG-1 [Sarcoptes scabiei]
MYLRDNRNREILELSLTQFESEEFALKNVKISFFSFEKKKQPHSMDSNVRNEAWSITTQPTFTWTPKGGTLSNWKVSSQSKQQQVYPPKLANAKKKPKTLVA